MARMRLQSSIEFMLLLAAVTGLGIAIIGMYSHSIAAQKAALYSMANASAHAPNSTSAGTISISGPYVEMPATSFVNRSNILLVMFSGSGARLGYVGIRPSGQYVTPGSYSNVSVSGPEVLEFSFVPSGPGLQQMELAYSTDGGPERYMNVSTYAVYANQPSPQPSQYTASIKASDEMLLFSVAGGSPLYKVTESSHCSYLTWNGQQLPISQQCGDAKWYYWGFSDSCYYSANPVYYSTTCIYLNQTYASVNSISSYPSKSFDIMLTVANSSVALHSNISAAGVPAGIYSANGKAFGNATVSNGIVYTGPEPSSEYVVRLINGTASLMNYTDYYAYQRAYDSMLSTLAYYNNTGSGGGSQVQPAISAYNSASYEFAHEAPSNASPCKFVYSNRTGAYACPPYSPFEFSNITASIPGAENQTLAVQGSTVNIR